MNISKIVCEFHLISYASLNIYHVIVQDKKSNKSNNINIMKRNVNMKIFSSQLHVEILKIVLYKEAHYFNGPRSELWLYTLIGLKMT